MTESKSKLVFRRSKVGFEANDPAGWDDLAIIKAYDSAVSNTDNIIMEENDDVSEIGEVVWKRNPGVEVKNNIEKNDAKPAAKSKNAARKARKRKKAEERKLCKWKVGDSCMAFYQDDQRFYKASIKEIHVAQGTAVVNYVDYDDDEVVALKDIHPESLWTDAGVDLDANQQETSGIKKTNKRQRIGRRRQNRSLNSDDVEVEYDSPLPFMPTLNDIGPDIPGLRNMPRDSKNLSKEAMSSMLVSWYMAGYQTGYYRGLTSSSR